MTITASSRINNKDSALSLAAGALTGGADRQAVRDWKVNRGVLLIDLAACYRMLSWAPLNGGFARANCILNRQIHISDRAATESPASYLAQLARSLGRDPRRTVGMMTGANVSRAGVASVKRGALVVGAWCTAGCSNALRAGDRATVHTSPAPGTINLIVVINQGLDCGALAEAIQISAEARVLAVQSAGISSVRSGLPATGTGTDCIVVASPESGQAHRYCGKHTQLGELIGRAVMRSCARALARRAN
ncbi:MAG: adenosylcobinamide amidohydrolase [Candidatus Binataceae bacterium]